MKKMILTALIIGLPLMTSANRYYNDDVNYGQVVKVEPIYQTVSTPVERQVCDQRSNNRYHNQNRRQNNNSGRAILGGIIGGVIGNRFGRGSGRDASTALGVLIGAGVGANQGYRHSNRRNCHIETHYREEDRFLGYDVTYDYNGNLYHTQMQEHPGDRVRLRVNIDVVD